MPASTYAPDPNGWINVSAAAVAARAAQASSAKKEPTQRPLVAVKHSGYPTPPTSNPRHYRSSSSSTTNENAPRSSAGPSRSKESQKLKQVGIGGFFATPPTTAPQPRRPLDRLKGKEVESSKGRGSPVSRSSALNSSKDRRRPLGSRLAKTELIDCFGSDTEEDEIEVDDDIPIAGPSKPRHPLRKKADPKQALLLPDVSRMLARVLSSGELSDLPPGYGDESESDDSETIPLPPTPPIPPPINLNNFPPSVPQNRVERLNPHLDPTQRHLAFEDDSQPNLTPLIMTQPPREVLKKHWRINGMSTEDIAHGAEPWGKSAGYLQNEQRMKEYSERSEQDTNWKASSSSARPISGSKLRIVRKSKVSVYQEEESDDDIMEVRRPVELAGEGTSGKRIPLSPVTLNKAKGARRMAPASPSPGKSAKKRKLDAAIHAPIGGVDAASAITHHQEMYPLPPSHLPLGLDQRSVTPKPDVVEDVPQRHHTVTPPKKRNSPSRNGEVSFAPAPSPSPFDFPSISEEELARPKEFKPVEIDETLMTWSPARAETMARDADIVEEAEEDAEEEGGNCDDPVVEEEAGEAVIEEVVPIRVAEETQSIPATEFSGTQSYPLLFASQIAAKRATPAEPIAPVQPLSAKPPKTSQSQPSSLAGPSRPNLSQKWAALQHSGLLQTAPPAPTPPSKAKAGTKRKSLKGKEKEEGQSSLEAFGIMNQRKPKRASGFTEDFEDEANIEEEEGDAGPSRDTEGFRAVPEAPHHPALRPAGIRAMQAREKAASTSTPRTRAQTRSNKGNSPVPPSSTPRGPARRPTDSSLDIFRDGSGSSPPSSSLLTDTTADQTPPSLRGWTEDYKRRRL